MLPPAHIAFGYLVGEVVVRTLGANVPVSSQQNLLIWASFVGFAPDLDMFYAFAKEKSLTIHNPLQNDHRKYWSHRPLLWLAVAVMWVLIAQSYEYKLYGLLVWLASWSHFVGDSLQYGVMWLWPFKRELIALKDVGLTVQNSKKNFWGYWIAFIRLYYKNFKLTLLGEVVVISIAIIVLSSRLFIVSLMLQHFYIPLSKVVVSDKINIR